MLALLGNPALRRSPRADCSSPPPERHEHSHPASTPNKNPLEGPYFGAHKTIHSDRPSRVRRIEGAFPTVLKVENPRTGHPKRIVVAMSGRVDSSVVAALFH